MRAVSNTSPISNLLRVGAVDLLFKLFEEVWIPPAVAYELLRFHAELPPRLRILAPTDTGRVQQLRDQLDDGEAEAIVLADELGTDWLIIDEKPGRRVARAEGIPLLGVAGLLLKAKQQRVITAVAPYLDELEQVAGFFLGKDVKAEVLRRAAELPGA
jgi:uncharacterized protein